MNVRRTRIAAAALAVAALAAWAEPARAARRADPVARLEADLAAVEAMLVAAERAGPPADETPAARAQRRFEDGRRQHALGDWLHAGIMLTEAADEPSWAGAPDRPEAVYLLADALRRQGLCGAARTRYRDYLASGAGPRRAAAVSAALECAVKEHAPRAIEELLRESERTFGAEPPAEVRYLAAKAEFQRTDLAPADRVARATAAFGRVGPPFQLQAWYFLGVLRIQEQNLHGSLAWFDRCARAEPAGERDAEVRDLCLLALGRVNAQMGNAADALRWYAAVPWDSTRSAEAMYEQALAHVRAKAWPQALRTASFVPELDPDSPVAPEATVLRGHLLLKLGHYADATETYHVVVNRYAPVRDELDALLAMREDPLRYFDELAGRRDGTFESALLPPIAVRWATGSQGVAEAMEVVSAIDRARADLKEAGALADRLEALLGRGGGVDAFPALQRGYALAQAVENAAARAEGAYVAEAAAVAERTLQPARRAELGAARAARAALEARFEALPRTAAAVDARTARMARRVDEVGRAAFRLGIAVDGNLAAVGGTEVYLDRHRAELVGDADERQAMLEELRRHRGVAEWLQAELATIRQELAKARDAAGGVEGMAEESRLRHDYLAAVERERELAEPARGSVGDADRAAFARMDRARDRLAAVRTRARVLKLGIASEATRRANEVKVRIQEERLALAAEAEALEVSRRESRETLGRVALRSLEEVRGMFYRVVLKADVGLVDVAWSRKRQRLEKIQTLAVQKDGELQQLDREFRSLAREVE